MHSQLRTGILKCFEQGLELLGGDYQTQLVSVHDPDEYLDSATSHDDRRRRFDDILGAYTALQELKSQGKASGIGVGAKNWNSAGKSIAEIDAQVDNTGAHLLVRLGDVRQDATGFGAATRFIRIRLYRRSAGIHGFA